MTTKVFLVRWDAYGALKYPNMFTCPGRLLPEFKQICEIQGDLSSIADTLPIRYGARGPYLSLRYQIKISYDGIQLRAQVEWEDAVSFVIGVSVI
jgi:hypothetical protein